MRYIAWVCFGAHALQSLAFAGVPGVSLFWSILTNASFVSVRYNVRTLWPTER